MKKEIKQKNKGVALIEVLIAMGILVLIIGAVSAFQADIFSFNRIINLGLKNQGEARTVIKPFANEVRGAVPSSLGAYPIETAGTSTFVFYSNIDDDVEIEKIRYFLEQKNEFVSDFKKGVINPKGNPLVYHEEDEQIIEVIHDVLNKNIFFYYNSLYDGTAQSPTLTQPVTPSEVRLIKIQLEIDSDLDNPPAPFFIETQASIRNLKDNL